MLVQLRLQFDLVSLFSLMTGSLKKERELVWITQDFFSLGRSRKCQGREQPSFRAGRRSVFAGDTVPAASPVGGCRAVWIRRGCFGI